MLDPRDTADHLLHGIDPDLLSDGDRVRFARALIAIAEADDVRTSLLIAALHSAALDHDPQGRDILVAVIRRRLRVLPPPPGVRDGLEPNGGT